MDSNLVCKKRSSALSTLDTIAGVMPIGTQRDALLAVRNWINKKVQPEDSREELAERLRKIFEGDEADRLGREWYNRGSEDINGELVPAEPGHGARVYCLWNAESKRWEPENSPPGTAGKEGA
jgi:hypothetical protein